MTGLKLIATHVKEHMHQDAAFEVYDQTKLIFKAFASQRTC